MSLVSARQVAFQQDFTSALAWSTCRSTSMQLIDLPEVGFTMICNHRPPSYKHAT
jgi:hypothetical protein